MSPITHFLVGWSALERALPARRDKALVALAGLAPDLDGLGIVVDFATRTLGLPETNYYQDFHRLFGHGLAAALVIALAVAALATARRRAAVLAFVSVHLHFACDLVGSRGNGPEDIWGIWYFAPFSTAHEIAWSGQWPLVGWQNMAITAVLLVVVLRRAVATGYSPLAIVSARADAALIAALRARFGRHSAR
ncbi:MAG: metal-dependent hydrolase [Burkholderiales bacterium]|nr:metal-dependent hydrolase [Burkholderiales bacterium]